MENAGKSVNDKWDMVKSLGTGNIWRHKNWEFPNIYKNLQTPNRTNTKLTMPGHSEITDKQKQRENHKSSQMR